MTPLRLILAVVAILALGPSRVGAAEPVKVRLGLLPLALHQLPLMAAKEKGYFADEGLDVQFTIFKGGSEVAPALLNGDIDVAQGVIAHPIKLHSKGFKVKILVLTQATPTFVLAFAPKHASINDVAELRGKNFKIAVARRGSDSDMMMRAVLAWKKLDPTRDVTLVQVASYANHLELLEQGQLDGAMILEPFAAIGAKRGILIPKLSFAEGQGPKELQDRPWTSLYVAETFYKEKRELARALVRAVVKGHKFIHDDVAGAVEVARKYFPTYDAEVLRDVLVRTRAAYSPAVTAERFEAENQYMIFAEIIDKPQPYAEIVATDFRDLWQ